MQNDDSKGLSELCYNVNDCLVTLRQLNYNSDLYSSETLRQAACRLPYYLTTKWAENCLTLRQRGEEPNLYHLGNWLRARVMAQKEAFLTGRQRAKPEVKSKGNEKGDERKLTLLGLNKPVDTKPFDTTPDVTLCPLCKGKHSFWKCQKYKRLEPVKKFEFIKSETLLQLFLGRPHVVQMCV